MRFRSLFLLCLPALLSACAKTDAPVRLDFIGTPGLTSGRRTVGPNDTIITRFYAVGQDHPLKRLRITVTYEPGLLPITYPLPLSRYDPKKNAPDPQTLVYLDSLIVPNAGTPSEYLFTNQFAARATSGTEQWQYTITDTQGNSTGRAYVLTVRKPDSAAVYHSYSTQLRPIPGNSTNAAAITRARVFVNLHYGLVLPKHALLNNALLNQEASVQDNQKLIDLLCLTNSTGTALSLSSPTDAQVLGAPADRWPQSNRRSTQLRQTSLTTDRFNAATALDSLSKAFNNGKPFSANPLNTGTLAKSQVIAFRTADGLYGLLLVDEVAFGSAPALSCKVRVQK